MSIRRSVWPLSAILFVGPLIAAEPTVSITRRGDTVDFKVGDALVTRYHIGEKVAKPFLWPLNAPNGVPLTRDWPTIPESKSTKDHKHHQSAWFGHGDIVPERLTLKHKSKRAEGVDFWAEEEGHGKIVFVKELEGGKADTRHASFASQNEWRTADGEKVLSETRTLRLFALDGAYLLVIESKLQADAYPIRFADTQEGSFGVRVRDELVTKGGKGTITNADGGVGEPACWGKLSTWCDYSGPLDGKSAGVAIFDHPSNPSPAAWHVRGYGLMAANPFGREKSEFPSQKGKKGEIKLAKGEGLTFVYGLLLHDGDVKAGKVAERYEEFLKLTAKK